MRRLSLNARSAFDAQQTDAVEVLLFRFEHPELAAPIRLSSDPTERLSTEPLAYGTRSGWGGANKITEPHFFVLASFEKPSDQEDAPPACRIVLENVTSDVARILRSVTTRPRAHMAVVLSDTPDVVEYEVRDLFLVAAEGDASTVPLTLSRDPIETETVPMDRFTPARFPGLYR